jgi:dienelactone hydrolase
VPDVTVGPTAALAPLTALARLRYDKAAAEDAWQRVFAFFGTYLK